MMPDYTPDYSNDDEYIPWDCDGGDDDLGNYDYDGWLGIPDG